MGAFGLRRASHETGPKFNGEANQSGSIKKERKKWKSGNAN